ncbi:MAG TPA: FAD/NAD(P)-binding oxidoreductase, partial [Candidatus Dormibacteraeota bacterium]|nr:FAD/NAD(P)-binding oxidoreductase [Candidatus Dormibacteraeota bacterium]
ASKWFERLRKSGAMLLDRTCVIAAPAPGLLLAEQDGQPRQIRWKRLILATGARELFLPFPGWTLPGVMGPGGLLSLAKNGWPVKNKRIVIAGSGPLLLAAAEGLLKQAAHVVTVVEQAPWKNVAGFGMSLWRHPAKLFHAAELKFKLRKVQCEFAAWPVIAEGTDQIRSVEFTNGQRTWSTDCDFLACGFGLVPNIELPLALGCELARGFVKVDNYQTTTVPNIFCAGEPTGIGGADCALAEGQIAGLAATNNRVGAEALFHERSSWHRFRERLSETFSLRDELKTLATAETIICRCEDVRLEQLRPFGNWREAKLHSRCGMGPCQGRLCGPATRHVLGWDPDSIRPPISPARVRSLISS